jgi:hypothetical protein
MAAMRNCELKATIMSLIVIPTKVEWKFRGRYVVFAYGVRHRELAISVFIAPSGSWTINLSEDSSLSTFLVFFPYFIINGKGGRAGDQPPNILQKLLKINIYPLLLAYSFWFLGH